MFGTDCDLVPGRSYHFSIFPFLFVGDQSSLDEDVVEQNVDHDVVSCVYPAAHFLAATDYVLSVECEPCIAAKALCLCLLCDRLLPLLDAEEVF